MRMRRFGIIAIGITCIAISAFGARLISAPRVDTKPSLFDKGAVHKGRAVTRVFEVRNEGWRDLVIDRVTETCVATTSLAVPAVIRPGATLAVTVTVQTKTLIDGVTDHIVMLSTNDPSRRSVPLVLTVDVSSEFALSATSMWLSDAAPEASIDVKSRGASDARIVDAIATDRRVKVTMIPSADFKSVHIVVSMLTTEKDAYDLGNVILTTTSEAMPEVRIPVRIRS